jgi:hypothetical protein
MSRSVGALLHTALTTTGHADFDRFEVCEGVSKDDIVVRFYKGESRDILDCLQFRIPNYVFDPVEYAQVKWPEWFNPKGEKTA